MSVSTLPSSLLLTALLAGGLTAQDEEPEPQETTEEIEEVAPAREPSHASLRLGYDEKGLCFGNAPRWTGLRFNFRDEAVQSVTGVNFTIWRARDNETALIRGFSLGLFGPEGGTLEGVAIGPAVVAHERMQGLGLGLLATVADGPATGVQLGGLATVGSESLTGLNLGGLAVVGAEEMSGFNLGGLATVCEGPASGANLGGVAVVAGGEFSGINLGGVATVAGAAMTGLNFGGVATVAGESMSGLNGAGLATVAGGRMNGLNVAGIATVAGEDIAGLSVAGMAIVADGDADGLQVAGLATVVARDAQWVNLAGLQVHAGRDATGLHLAGYAITAGEGDLWDWAFHSETDPEAATGTIRGFALACGGIRADRLDGVALAGLMTRTCEQRGFSSGLWHEVRGAQRGLSIGGYNSAKELHGVQLGLLNYAGNNPWPFRLLPLVNVHFD